MPEFSVIIPTFNRSKMVRQAIDSVLAQNLDDHEIIVVDDGSTDNTTEVLETYGDGIRILSQANQGPQAARNEGFRAAKGAYTVFLDSDDMLLPWALEVYRKTIASTRQPALLMGAPVYFSSDEPYLPGSRIRSALEIVEYKDVLSKDRSVFHTFSAMAVQRRSLEEIGGFRKGSPDMFQEDNIDFLLRFGSHGPFVLILQPAVVAYRQHASNSLKDFRQLVEGFRSNIGDERRGCFQGGRSRLLDRYSLIGGSLGFWSLKCFRQKRYRVGLELLTIGYPMVLARLLKLIALRRRGLTPSVKLSECEGGCSGQHIHQ